MARHKRRAPLALRALAAAALGFALGVGAFLALHALQLTRAGWRSANAPDGRVIGWAVRAGEEGFLTAAADADALRASAQAQAVRAKEAGANALFVFVQAADGTLCRVRGAQTSSLLTQRETLLSRPDALAALCRAASKEGLAVYAVLESGAPPSAQALERRYAIAGTAAYDAAEGMFDMDAFAGAAQAGRGALPALDGEEDVSGAALANLVRRCAEGGAGAVLDGALRDAGAAAPAVGVLQSSYPALLGYRPAASLAVTGPAAEDGALPASDERLFVTGTSDPAQGLYLDGQPVQRWGAKGLFGVLLTGLLPGENTYTLTQDGGASVSFTVRRTQPAAAEPPAMQTPADEATDDTREVQPGTRVRMTGAVTSLLYDPSDDGNINETARRGAVGVVQGCALTQRGSARTWAYQLTSGDWVLARQVQVLEDGAAGTAQFTSAEASPYAPADPAWGELASPVPDGRTETLVFAGSGAPVAYTNHVGNTLSLRFYDADVAPDFSVQGSQLVRGVQVKPFEGGCELILSFDEPLWGHLIAYEAGTVRVTVKMRPAPGADAAQPLAGVRVLLDAGHGGEDAGALGAGGAGAPAEKDLNLAAALAVAHRLRALGAQVYLVRTDDTARSLEARNEAISAVAPDFFLSLHQNSVAQTADANDAFGTECYYFYPAGKALAEALVGHVTAALGRRDRGAMWGYYYVTRNTMCPAVLLEMGFAASPAEYESLSDDAQIWAAGEAIARAVAACLAA